MSYLPSLLGSQKIEKDFLKLKGNNIQQSVEKSGPFGSSDTDTILLMDQKSYNTTWILHENLQENKWEEILLIHPRNLTWIPKIAIFKGSYLFQTIASPVSSR